MNNWTRARWTSFIVHVAFVSVPFVASSVSALLLWEALFNSWWLAVPAVLVVDVLALTGLVLYIARVPSPFVPLRHALPFVSIVPLGRELYLLLAHNGIVTAVTVTLIAVGVLTTIAWKCFDTIERLFIPPVEAAREKAREQLSHLTVELAQLSEKNAVVEEFVTAWRGQAVQVTITDDRPALPDSSKTARVKALAVERGVSESSAWRKVKSGEWSI